MISLKDFLILTKFKLSFTVSLSMLFAFIIANNSLSWEFLYPFLAVLLLALGVSALNQIQEAKEDALMERTKNRPLAAKRITKNEALTISLSLVLIALILIYQSLSFFGLFLFFLVLVLYNIFYTKAKKITIYAAVYGAILGVVPPLIGWLSAKQEAISLEFLALGLFYFIWQIPHFWLLTLKYYKQYEKASFPTVAKAFGIETLERITFIWLLLTLIAGSFLLMIFSSSIYISLLGSLLTIYILNKIFILRVEHNYLKCFISINIYMLSLMLILVLNALFF